MMANQQHLDLLRQGIKRWNQWREERKEQEEQERFEMQGQARIKKRHPHLVDLSGVNMEGWDLRRANFSGANLQGTRLVRADLQEAKLNQADLYEALFNQANLEGADLSGASLMKASMADANLGKAILRKAGLARTSFFHAFLGEADLREADLTQTNFTWANLYGMNVEGAYVNHTIFADVDLSEVKGLELLRHSRPPIIDIYTLARSSGRIPETFLRHSGVETAIIPALLALFHPYHGAETWWWSEERGGDPWRTDERPTEVPHVCPGFWTHQDDLLDETL